MVMLRDDYLVWIDCEMTGLHPEKDRLLEIATVVTDSQLRMVAEGPVLAIWQTEACLTGMDAWCVNQHGQSGLTARVKTSQITESGAEKLTLGFLSTYINPGSSPLCGNSIWQDRRFLIQYMPTLANFFHYRNIDVSTVKELAKRWRPDLYKKMKKSCVHLALADIYESIEELRYYRSCFLKSTLENPGIKSTDQRQ